jgi:hypothetical protein
VLCPKRRRRSLAGRPQPGTEDSGGVRGPADDRNGYSLGWREIEVCNGAKSMEGGQSRGLKGHEGHYIHAEAYLYPDKNLIHVIEVKLPTARETGEPDIK